MFTCVDRMFFMPRTEILHDDVLWSEKPLYGKDTEIFKSFIYLWMANISKYTFVYVVGTQ